jgi:hypothetical protein
VSGDRISGKLAPLNARKIEENGKKKPRVVGATVAGNDPRFLNAVFSSRISGGSKSEA